MAERLTEGNVACPACAAVIAWEGERPSDCLRCGFPLDRSCRYCDDDPVGFDALGRVACAAHIESVAEDVAMFERAGGVTDGE